MIGVPAALVVVAAAFGLALVRAVKGPSVADRSLGADLGLYSVVAAIALLAVLTGYEQFLDVVVVATLLGFIATIAFGALISRRGS